MTKLVPSEMERKKVISGLGVVGEVRLVAGVEPSPGGASVLLGILAVLLVLVPLADVIVDAVVVRFVALLAANSNKRVPPCQVEKVKKD